MRIDFYEFGRIQIEGKEYTHDLLILPGRIVSPWWRVEGHRVGLKDLEAVWEEKISYLVIGTGAHGMMKVEEAVKERAGSLGIKLIIKRTAEAIKIYNQYKDKEHGQIGGAFHLTC